MGMHIENIYRQWVTNIGHFFTQFGSAYSDLTLIHRGQYLQAMGGHTQRAVYSRYSQWAELITHKGETTYRQLVV